MSLKEFFETVLKFKKKSQHTNLNIFFSETTWLIKLKFHMEYALD